MDIWMIWARQGGTVWLEDAWDDDSITENPRGWEGKVAQARQDYGPRGEVRVIKACIDFDAVLAAFKTPTVSMSDPKVQA